ncbi:MAG TPA: FtsX-like permease family protein, partial [Pirellulales bacterium]|nr:FtsX-like permease family protein [Pirellulales bacterium]
MNAPAGKSLSAFRFLRENLGYHRRMNFAVALGVMAGTAVLTGALLVGDSVRGSLRDLTLDRLGPVDEALVANRFFRTKLAAELNDAPGFHERFGSAVPAIVLEASVQNPDNGDRANRVSIYAAAVPSWPAPKSDELILNAPLAAALGARAGDEVLVRLPAPSEIPRDSALGRKTETISTRRLRVGSIVAANGAGRFSLRPNQSTPLVAFVGLDALAEMLKQPDHANAILVTARDDRRAPEPADHAALQQMLRPRLADFGLHVVPESPHSYFNLTSDRMLLDTEAESSAMQAFRKQGAQPVFTYLANTIAAGDKQVPYSTVAGIDLRTKAPLGPWMTPDDRPIDAIGDDAIVLNQWAADDLNAKPGDTITLTYFLPESTHGEAREANHAFRLAAVCAMIGPAVDPNLTPTLPGVTDQLSIADWNPPFPFDSTRVRKKDEDYWDEYRATPKAFIHLATARKLFGSRFGDTTSIRVPPTDDQTVDDDTAAALAARWKPDPVASGFVFQPVKAQGLAASAGTTPFNGLFIGFSFFIIVAALMLVVLLFRLGIERRATEIGTLRALGYSTRQVRRMLLAEGLLIAALGAAAGTGLGVGYAWLMIVGLRTWWVAAVSTPFLHLHLSPLSLIGGYFTGVFTSAAAITWALRMTRHVPVRSLLAGDFREPELRLPARWSVSRIVAVVAILAALGISIASRGLSGEAQAGGFFGAGALVLVAALAWLWSRLRVGAAGSVVAHGPMALAGLALRNGARNPGRTALTVGLVASASFLILAISAFHVEPPAGEGRKDIGTGGFALVAESDQPIYQNINSREGRYDLGFSTAGDKMLDRAGVQVYSLRVESGDDASCLNLYQVQQPRVLGVPEALIERGGFSWAASAAAAGANPWSLLNEPSDNEPSDDDSIPAVLDYATAVYSLHLSGKPGDRFTMTDGRGRPLVLRVVGLLANSVFQGSLLVGEQAFLERFPDASGYRFFLVDAPVPDASSVQTALNKELGDYGFEAQSAADRLAGYLVVQNTYLETFQSLG